MFDSHVSRWLARLWNAVVVPRVEEAIIARVTTKRSSSISPSSPSQRPSLSNCGLSAGQQAVVKAALSILVNKAVLLGCPLRRHGAWAPQDGEGSSAASGGCFGRAKNGKMTSRDRFLWRVFPQRWTDTCWSSAVETSRCRASAPTKEAAAEGGGEGATAAS